MLRKKSTDINKDSTKLKTKRELLTMLVFPSRVQKSMHSLINLNHFAIRLKHRFINDTE